MIRRLRLLLDSRQQRHLLLVLLGLCAAAALEMVGIAAVPVFVALLTDPDRVLTGLPDGRLGALVRETDLARLTLLAAGGLAGLFLLKNLFLAALVYAEERVLRSVTMALAARLFHAYLYAPYTFHLQRNPAHLINNIGNETSQAASLIRGGVQVLREGLVLCVVFVLLLLFDPLVSLSLFVLLGTAAALFYAAVRRGLARRGRLAQSHRGRQMQAISQGLAAIKDAKILGREAYLLDVFRVENRGKEGHELYGKVMASMPRLFLEVVAISAVLVVAVVFVLLGRPTQAMLPVLALLAVAVVRLVPAFNAITSALSTVRYHRASLDLISTEFEVLDAQAAPVSAPPGAAAGVVKMETGVQLVDVRYQYPGAGVEALRGVSLVIPRGDAVAFIGPTGAGKSTLIDVVLGLLTPTAGEVRVDGRDIQPHLTAWQRQIGYVPQEIYLTDDTIRRNIAFGLPDEAIDEPALARAVAAARLDEVVRGLPAGLDTPVGNRGVRLSGGQRQRIGIARALYHDPDVLVMDEATSALDADTEREVIDAIGRLRGGRTIVMIAHRLTTVKDCDRLYMLQDGRVVDQGSFAELARRHEQMRILVSAEAGRR